MRTAACLNPAALPHKATQAIKHAVIKGGTCAALTWRSLRLLPLAQQTPSSCPVQSTQAPAH
jgi:hypothetical protein